MAESDATAQGIPNSNTGEVLSKLALELSNLKRDIDKREIEIDNKGAEFRAKSQLLLKIMEASDIGLFKSHGFSFSVETRQSIRTPKSLEDKRALFDFLNERGIFDEIVSVNSHTLNALYKSLAEDAAKRGELDFRLPGVEAPTVYTNLKMRSYE